MNKINKNNYFRQWDIIPSLIKLGSYNFLYNIILALSAFVFWMLIANKFSPENYGQARTIFAIISIISVLLQFGLPTYNQIIHSQNSNIDDEYSNVVPFKMLLLFAYLISTATYFFIDTKKYNLEYIITIVIIFFLEDIIRFLVGIYYGRNDFSYVFKSSLISRLTLLLVLVIIFLYDLKLSYYLIAFILANLIQLLILILNKNYKSIIIKIPKIKLSNVKNLLFLIFPLGLNNVFNLLYDKIDLPLISYYIDFNNVAQYSISYSIYSLSGIVFGIFLIPAFNYFSNTSHNSYDKIRLLIKLFLLIILCSFFIIACFVLFGKSLILLLLGAKYLQGARLLPFFSLSIIFLGLNSLFGVYLNAQKRFKATMYAVLFGLITNTVIDILTLPHLGIMGGVIATTSTMFVVLIIELFFVLRFWKSSNENSFVGKV